MFQISLNNVFLFFNYVRRKFCIGLRSMKNDGGNTRGPGSVVVQRRPTNVIVG